MPLPLRTRQGSISMFSQQIKHLISAVFAALFILAVPAFSYAKLPSAIAVLPVSGDGQPEDLKELRVTFFNHIGSKNYADTELSAIDSKIFLMEEKSGKQWQDFTTKELGDALGVDGLVYVNVLGVDKIYAGIYGSLTVSMAVKLVDAETGAIIWEKEDRVVKQSGSIPLSPWSAISTAVSSALVLRDSVKIGLFDELCRGIAKQMPEPVDLLRLRPPTIFSVVTNALDSPFKTGSEILVSLKGDEGLDAYFDIGTMRKGIEMQETAPGQYLGKYVVVSGDNWENQTITVSLNNKLKRTSAKTQVPYQIIVDTVPPAQPTDFASSIAGKGLRLTWTMLNEPDMKDYIIQKATIAQPEYAELAHTPLNEYTDENIEYGQKVFYRLLAKDTAGNLSRYSEISRMVVKPGPTEVSGELKESTTFYALASPYIIKGALKVPKGIRLDIEEGTVLKFEDGASLLVEGSVKAIGSEKQNIVFRGKNYTVSLADTGDNGGIFEHVFFHEGTGLTAANSSVSFTNCRIEGLEKGISLLHGATVKIFKSRFTANKTGLAAGAGSLACSESEFSGNETAISVADADADIKDVIFRDNSMNLAARKPLNIKSVLMNDRPSFEVIRSFQGDVTIDNIRPFGKSLTALKNDSSNDLSSQVAETLSAGRFTETDRLLDTMKELFPERYETVKPLHGYVMRKAGKDQEGAAMMAAAKAPYSKVLESPNQSGIRFVRVRIPALGSGEGIGKLAVSKASRQAVKSFTDEAAGSLDREKNFTVNEKIYSVSDKYVDNSFPLLTSFSGNFFDGLYLVQIRPETVVNDLTELGIIGGKGRNLRIAVVSCSADNNILPTLVNNLAGMKFTVTELSARSCSVGDYRDEAKRSSDLLLIVKEQFGISESRVSKNLKMISADLTVNMYDLRTGGQIYDTSKGSVVYHMNQSMGKKSAILSCYEQVRDNLMNKVIETDRKK